VNSGHGDPAFARLSVWRDLGIALALAAVAAGVAAVFDFYESWFDFSRRWEALQLDELLPALLVFALSLAVLLARRHHALRRALERNRELGRWTLQAQEQERRRLAREIHDELGQHLNALQLDAAGLVRAAGGSPLAAGGQQLLRGLGEVQRVVRDLVRELRPAGLDELGLVPALEAMLQSARERQPQPALRLVTFGKLEDLGEELNLTVYRLVQESLTNILRHAAASQVEVALQQVAGSDGRPLLTLEVQDDGRGLPGNGGAEGHGLAGMRERVTMLGGRLELRSTPGAGTTIRAEFPLQGVPA
jgi:signal transduction histidine kinase